MAEKKNTEEIAEKPETVKDAKRVDKPERVKITLFRDNEKYKNDVFVAVNGRAYKIKRGIEVEVPPSVYEVLEASHKQDIQTAEFIEKATTEYSNIEKILG